MSPFHTDLLYTTPVHETEKKNKTAILIEAYGGTGEGVPPLDLPLTS